MPEHSPDPIRQEHEQRETQNRWNTRLKAYAWVLFLLATAVFMSQWSSELRLWMESAIGLTSHSY